MTDDQMADALLTHARVHPPAMTARLRDQLRADATAQMSAARAPSFWRIIGGGWGASGLAMATMAGVWIGLAPLSVAASWADPLALLTTSAETQDELDWGEFGWSLEEG